MRLRLDITMRQAGGMGHIECSGDLTDDVHRPGRFERALGDQLVERVPVHQADVDIEPAVGLTRIVNGYDVWFLQSGRRLGLTLEPLPKRGIVGDRVARIFSATVRFLSVS